MKFIFIHPLRHHSDYNAQFTASNSARFEMGMSAESFEEWFAHGRSESRAQIE
jgi:hypothetical protein